MRVLIVRHVFRVSIADGVECLKTKKRNRTKTVLHPNGDQHLISTDHPPNLHMAMGVTTLLLHLIPSPGPLMTISSKISLLILEFNLPKL